MEEYFLREVLYERTAGIYSYVRRAICKSDGREVVLKSSCGDGSFDLIAEKEVYDVLGDHKGLLEVIDYFGFGKDSCCLVLEAGVFDLQRFEALFGQPDDTFLWKVKKSVLTALRHIHSLDIFHCDIKPSNILVMRDGSIKLFDFGNAISKEEGDKASGTELISSPEVLSGSPTCDEKIDYWSLGVSLYLVRHAIYPFPGETPKQILRSMIEQLGQPSEEDCPSLFKILDEVLEEPVPDDLRKNPVRLSHPLFRDLICYDPKKRIAN